MIDDRNGSDRSPSIGPRVVEGAGVAGPPTSRVRARTHPNFVKHRGDSCEPVTSQQTFHKRFGKPAWLLFAGSLPFRNPFSKLAMVFGFQHGWQDLSPS